MKLQAKGKIKRAKAEAQKELEENFELPTKESQEGYSHYGKGEVSTKEIVQIFADELEEVAKELGSPFNRPSAEDKALQLVRTMRIHNGVKFLNV